MNPKINQFLSSSAPNPHGKIGAALGREEGPNKKEKVGRMGPTRIPNSFGKKDK